MKATHTELSGRAESGWPTRCSREPGLQEGQGQESSLAQPFSGTQISYHNGCLELWLPVPVVPYVRQTHTTRWRKDEKGDSVRRYNDFKAQVNNEVGYILKTQGFDLPIFSKVPLAFTFFCYLRSVYRADLSNYLKSVEDALTGVAYVDDRWIVQTVCGKMLADKEHPVGFAVVIRHAAP